jgi:queuine tRNA-ribosyltransferase
MSSGLKSSWLTPITSCCDPVRRSSKHSADYTDSPVGAGICSPTRVDFRCSHSRGEYAKATAALEFDGYGIGGLSVGEPRDQMLPALAAAVAELPADRPRYLMGVGDPVTLLDAISLGVDMFDCVLPTRLARHGTALTSGGRYQVRAARHATDDQPLDPTCPCRVCARFSRGYVRHLLVASEPTGGRLLSVHNLAWLLALVERSREAIRAGTLAVMRADVAAIWEPGSLR